VVYGNWTQVISLYYSSSSSNETQQTRGDERVVPIQEISCRYDKISADVLENAIAAYDPEFDMSAYEISAVSTSEDNTSFVVDVTQKIGDFSTNNGYTFIFHDNKADAMYNNTIDTEGIELKNNTLSEKADSYVKEAYKTAANKMEDGYYITDQTSTKYYDITTGKCYNKVLTECKEVNGDCYYSYSTLVPIS
jgi:hypothetical protein